MDSQPVKRRRWISGIAWLSIAMGLIIAINSAFSLWVWWSLKREFPESQGLPIPPEAMAMMPPQFQLYFKYFAHGHVVFLLFGFIQSVLAVGLLTRAEWGRLGTVVILWLTVIAHLAGIPMTLAIRDLIFASPLPSNADPEMVYRIAAGLGFAYIGITILICGLLIRKLGKPEVKAEFIAQQSVPADTGSVRPSSG